MRVFTNQCPLCMKGMKPKDHPRYPFPVFCTACAGVYMSISRTEKRLPLPSERRMIKRLWKHLRPEAQADHDRIVAQMWG